MITKLKELLLGLLLISVGYSMEAQALEKLELRAYILTDDIPKYMPVDCPIVNEQVQDDITALRILNTVTYELIHFYGTENLAGSEGYDDSSIVDWEIIYAGKSGFEVVLKTKAIRLGQKIYSFMEAQQSQECLNWGLVISNEEVVVLEEGSSPIEDQEVESYEFTNTYEQYDPYEEDYATPAIRTNSYEDPIDYNPVPRRDEGFRNTLTNNYNPIDRNSDIVERPIATTTSDRSDFNAVLPEPSDQLNLPTNFFRSLQSLGDAEQIISSVLSANGYSNKGYFEFDNGFMIATQLEHFNSNGTSKRGQYRYPSRVTFNQSLSFQNYLNTLYLPERGKFRMFVFYVEGAPKQTYSDFNEIDYSLSASSSTQKNRADAISEQLANKPYRHKNNFDSNVTVMVYECQTRDNERRPTLLEVSSINAKDHLVRSGLWESFNQR